MNNEWATLATAHIAELIGKPGCSGLIHDGFDGETIDIEFPNLDTAMKFASEHRMEVFTELRVDLEFLGKQRSAENGFGFVDLTAPAVLTVDLEAYALREDIEDPAADDESDEDEGDDDYRVCMHCGAEIESGQVCDDCYDSEGYEDENDDFEDDED